MKIFNRTQLIPGAKVRSNSKALVVVTFAALSPIVHAEGSRDLHPTGYAARNLMDVRPAGNDMLGLGPAKQFLYTYAQAGEVILVAANGISATNDVLIYNPQDFGPKGNEIPPVASDFSCNAQGSGRGVILNNAQESAGPNSADGSSTVLNGYAPCFYVAPVTGIYGVRFTASGGFVSRWDVTVRNDQKSITDLKGRLFSYSWVIRSSNVNSNLYYVSSDGYRYSQKFDTLDAYEAVFFANSSGFLDANGGPLYKDLRGNSGPVNSGPYVNAGIKPQRPQYPIFFNDVSPAGPNSAEVDRVLTALAIPLEPSAPILRSPTFVGNLSGNTSYVSSGGVFKFSTENTLTYEIVVSRDGVDFDPANPSNRVLTGVALSGDHSVIWDGRDNMNASFPEGNYLFKITGRNGEIHFPMVDVEGNVAGGPALTKLNGPSAGDDTVYYDDRGYRTASGVLIGELNGHLCGSGYAGAQPTPNHSLLGISSTSGYRSWPNTGVQTNADCGNTNRFGDAKALDLWSFEKTAPVQLPIEIVTQPIAIDVGTSASATPSVLSGDTAYGQFSFYNASSAPATGLTYNVSIGDFAAGTCPAAVSFAPVPVGVTVSYSAATCAVSFVGMPDSLTGGQQLNFGFSYVVAPSNAGPIPVRTQISAGNEDNDVAPNTATAQTLVATPQVSVAKRAAPTSNAQLSTGDTVTYSVAVTVANAPTTASFTFTDTPGAGLAFGSVTTAHASFSCNSALVCSLPAGTAVGTYTVSYTAVVQGSAGTSVTNQVQITGNGGDSDPVCVTCTVTHSVAKPAIALIKTGVVDKGSDGILNAGDTINYHFSVTNTGNVPLTAITVAELTFSGTGAAPVISGGPIDLAVGATDSSTFTASYQITQKDIDAGGVSNQARAQGSSPNRSGDVSDLSDGSNPAGDQPTQTPLTTAPTAPQSVPVNAPWGIALLMVCMLAFANRERLGTALKR